MKIFLHLLLLVIFTLWLIPLGQFISKDRQSQICGGQRAVCMCLVPAAKKAVGASTMIVTNTAPSSSQKEAPGGAGHYFETAAYLPHRLNPMPLNLPPMQQLPLLLMARNIEHIPKNSLS